MIGTLLEDPDLRAPPANDENGLPTAVVQLNAQRSFEYPQLNLARGHPFRPSSSP